jgi:hypothetical protein
VHELQYTQVRNFLPALELHDSSVVVYGPGLSNRDQSKHYTIQVEAQKDGTLFGEFCLKFWKVT